MVDKDVVAAKLAELAHRTARIRERCPPDSAALAADRDALELVAFNLLLSVQACLDVASHLIADEGWPPAATLASAFIRLHGQGVISDTTAESLAKAVGLRNIVAHGYGSVVPERIHAAATGGLADLDRFAREVSAWIAGRS